MNDSTFFNTDFLSNNDKAEKAHEESQSQNKENNKLNPSSQSIKAILDYSKAVSIRKSNEMGFIENVLN